MRFQMPALGVSLFVILSATPLVNCSWGIPEDLEDGVYQWIFPKVFYSGGIYGFPEGYEVSTTRFDVDPNVNITAVQNDEGHRFPRTDQACWTDISKANATEYIMANAMLSNWCEMYNPPATTILGAVYGEAVSFMCQPHDNDFWKQSCSRYEIDRVSASLDFECGNDSAGRVKFDKWHKAYGRTKRGAEIC